MWLDAVGAHRAKEASASSRREGETTLARASSPFFADAVADLRGGAVAAGPGRHVSAPMTWTYPGDMAATLIAAANDDASLGRAWHAVSNAPRSQQQFVDDLADAAGLARQRV